ncbi:MAG: Crp/Fnr family transcriptional regulator [Chloroflexi bacterium]|nr:Crp/Fnr family transcriptional regulator [Chloroflexota bacterium]MBU1749091.1 Crp/Fnr family transcriptional regulator [Chloroflexota bacterium]MBU1877379.1 Crp/Fnr family transcriptional regulator [Chloroflexota bacterium]
MSTHQRQRFLQNVPLFSGLSEAELVRLAGDTQQQRFAAGQAIFCQGDPGRTVYIVQAGRVRIYVHGDATRGQEVSMMIYGPGDIFGEMALVDRQPRSATAEAMEDVSLLVIRDDDFTRHLQHSHQLALNLMVLLSTRLRDTTQAVESLATLDVTHRLVKRLLYLADQHGIVTREGIRIQGRLTQQDLASLISTSRESANRALRDLERQGLIAMNAGRIIILKPHELAQLVAGQDGTVDG